MNKCIGEATLLLVTAMGKTWVEDFWKGPLSKPTDFWGGFNFAYSMAQ
jgi:hypothetical protein